MMLFEIDFTDEQWELIVNLSFEPFEFSTGDSLTCGQWEAIGDMALGKAERVHDLDSQPLREIASVIFTKLTQINLSNGER